MDKQETSELRAEIEERAVDAATEELRAELSRLREYKAIADAAGTGRLIQERDSALAQLDSIRAAFGHGADENTRPPGMTLAEAVTRLREELERAKEDRNRAGVIERRKYLPQLAELNRKVAAADGLVSLLKDLSKKTITYATKNTMSGDCVTVDTGKPTDTATNARAALAAWQEASRG